MTGSLQLNIGLTQKGSFARHRAVRHPRPIERRRACRRQQHFQAGGPRNGRRKKADIFHFPTPGQIVNREGEELRSMFVLDPPALLALATLISSISALVWSIRRKA
jgi:hypothetical protein